jgi:hypothetical protein
MKSLATALLAPALLAASYLASAPSAEAGGKRCASYSEDTLSAEVQTNADLDAAIDLARHGFPVRAEVEALRHSVAAEELTYVGLPDQCVIQHMLTQELNQLHALALMYMVHQAELHQAELQVVLGRFERAVMQVDQAWAAGEIADDIAFMAVATMRAEASAYLDSIGVASIRGRLEAAMALLIARGTDAMQRAEAVHDTYQKLYELRLEVSLAVLQQKLQDGSVTKLDVQRVESAVKGLENLKHALVPFDCAS